MSTDFKLILPRIDGSEHDLVGEQGWLWGSVLLAQASVVLLQSPCEVL